MRYVLNALVLILALGAMVWLALSAPWWILVPAGGMLVFIVLSIVLGAGAAPDEERQRREEPHRMWPPRG
jgi:membrane protein YdbS with pleckstrin-like domain